MPIAGLALPFLVEEAQGTHEGWGTGRAGAYTGAGLIISFKWGSGNTRGTQAELAGRDGLALLFLVDEGTWRRGCGGGEGRSGTKLKSSNPT